MSTVVLAPDSFKGSIGAAAAAAALHAGWASADPSSTLVPRPMADGGEPECAERALKRGGFQKSFRSPVVIGPEVIDLVDEWRRSASTR